MTNLLQRINDECLTPEQQAAGVHDDGEWRGPNLQEWIQRVMSRQVNPDGAPTPSIRQSERHAPSWDGPMIERRTGT